MTILAIETTGQTCGVALLADGDSAYRIMDEHAMYGEHVHDAHLTQLTVDLLAATQCTLNDVDFVAVSGGPGSFTGTRIGVAFAKGLTMGGTPQLIVVDTSMALAHAVRQDAHARRMREITVAIPSHQQLIYVDHYTLDDATLQRKAGWTRPLLMSLDDAIREHSSAGEARFVCGPAATQLAPDQPSTVTALHASMIGALAYDLLASSPEHQVVADPLTAEPLYRQEFKGRHLDR